MGIADKPLTDKQQAAQASDPTKNQATDAKGEKDLKLNTPHIAYSNNSSYSKDKTLATLGQGAVTVTDDAVTGDDSTERLNRDTGSTTKELYAIDRQQGNVDLTIDTRLLSEEGRQDIKNNVTDTHEFGQDIVRAAHTVSDSENLGGVVGLWKTLNNNVAVTALKNDLLRNPENANIRDKINSNDPVINKQGLQELTSLAQTKYGIDLSEVLLYSADQTTSTSLQDVIVNGMTFIDTKGGTVSEQGHQERGSIFIDVSNSDSKKDQVSTLGTEILRTAELNGSSDLQTSSDTNAQGDLSKAFGSQLANRIDQTIEGGLDSNTASSFYNDQQNSAVVAAGTQRANTVANASVLYRQLHKREIAVVERIADQYAQDNNLSPDQARRELTQTALGLVDKKWSEQEHINNGSTDTAKKALLDAVSKEEAISLFSEGEGWFNSKKIALFTADDKDFEDTYLFSDQTRLIESPIPEGLKGIIPAELNRYISRYGLPEGETPLIPVSGSAIMGQAVSDIYETTGVINDAIIKDGVVGTAKNAGIAIVDSLVDFASDCSRRGVKCAIPDSVNHGLPSAHMVVDSLQRDPDALLASSTESVKLAVEILTIPVGGGVIKSLGKSVDAVVTAAIKKDNVLKVVPKAKVPEGNVAGGNTKWTVEQPLDSSGSPIVRTNDRGSIQVQPNGSVTCGQHSCGMVLNTQGNPIAVTDIIAKRPPDVDGGTYLTTLKKVFSDNGVKSTTYNSGVKVSQLKSWTSNGKPVIATVKTGDNTFHYVVVDGVTKRNGIDVVAIRDPAGKINGGVYYETLESFNKRFVGSAVKLK